VGGTGLEPVTSRLSSWRSPTELSPRLRDQDSSRAPISRDLAPGRDNPPSGSSTPTISPVRRISDPADVDWLDERAPQGSNVTGYDAAGWEASIWILHAMYETAELPAGVTHDDVHRIERAAGLVEPAFIGEVDLEEPLADAGAKVVGSSLGRSAWPGPGWERLSWSKLAKRLGVDPFAIDVPPGLRSFPYTSWPANIAPPGEGSLDREQFIDLVDHLAAVTPKGDRAPCFAFYAMVMTGDYDHDTLYTAELRELIELYDDEDLPGSPSNIWPDDRSWLVYTDADLWATKVSGSAELIARLRADPELEVVTLPF
jgi:hypothetical protein